MIKPSLKNKTNRVLKKLYLGKYAMLGFVISASFVKEDETAIDSFFDDMIDFMESNNLGFGGGYTIKDFDGFITSAERYNSPTEAQRLAVQEWLSKQSNLSNILVAELVDANYVD